MIPTPAKRARWREEVMGALNAPSSDLEVQHWEKQVFGEALQIADALDELERRLAATVEAGMMFHSKDCVATGVALSMREPCDCGATLHNEKVRQAAARMAAMIPTPLEEDMAAGPVEKEVSR